MKRYAIFLSLIAFGYILGWTGSVLRFGLSPFAMHRGPPDHRPEAMFEGIGLNADQKEAIRKIRAEEKDQKQAQREKNEAARREFEKTLDSSQDITVLQAAFERMIESKIATERAHFASMMKVHQILTLEQIQKLSEKRPRRGRGGPGGLGSPGGLGGPGGGPDDGPRGGPPPPEDR